MMDNTSQKTKRGATKHCAYGTCNSDSRYSDRPSMLRVNFLRFPQYHKDAEKCKRWARACSRQGFDENSVKKDTYICSLHFVGGNGPTDDYPDPIPATATKFDVQRIVKKPRRRINRRLFLTPKLKPVTDTCTAERTIQLPANNEDCVSLSTEIAEILLSLRGDETSVSEEFNKENSCDIQQVSKKPCTTPSVHKSGLNENQKINTSCQTNQDVSNVSSENVGIQIQNRILTNENILLKSENTLLKSKIDLLTESASDTDRKSAKSRPEAEKSDKDVRPAENVHFDISHVTKNDKKCKFYTGLSWIQFLQLWMFLSPAVEHLKYWNTVKYRVSPKNALLMTLMRLRHGFTSQDLAYRFGTSTTTVSSIILTWIQFLYSQFLPLKDFMFASRDHIKANIPHAFKKYKNIRCIIDCSEFFSQRPGNFQRQGNLYSSYKAHTTYKVLVAVAPNGSIMFVSDTFEGSISDKDIVVKSGFLEYLRPGDVIMADRGFNIRDILNEYKVELIIPPFLGGRRTFTPQEEALTKDIAKHRIHVERAIERIKNFKILQNTIPLCLEPVITQIVFVVCCLVNFQAPLVK